MINRRISGHTLASFPFHSVPRTFSEFYFSYPLSAFEHVILMFSVKVKTCSQLEPYSVGNHFWFHLHLTVSLVIYLFRQFENFQIQRQDGISIYISKVYNVI